MAAALRRLGLVTVMALGLLGIGLSTGAGGTVRSDLPSGAGGPAVEPVPVVYDTDVDFDDTMALAYLAGEDQAGQIKLLAVTAEIDGAGLPVLAPVHARCILNRSGLSGVPVAEGRFPSHFNVMPPELRLAAEAVIEPALPDCLPGPVHTDAPQLLANSILASATPVTVITTGPLTNVAAALTLVAQHPGGLDHVGHVYSMMGAFAVSGGLCCTTSVLASGTQEVNAWIDPAADQTVLGLVGDRWTFVPIDATNDVPITAAAVAHLKADHSTPEASYVAIVASSPLLALGKVEPAYFWDPLAAVVAVTGQAVTFSTEHVSFVQSGRTAGVVAPDPTGPLVTYASSADPAAFLRLFQAGLDQNG